jgi:hypothetical protein
MAAATSSGRVDFARINAAALAALPALLAGWLPDGEWRGSEYVARNPKRADRHRGSISLGAYLADLSQPDAARELARALGIDAA